MLGEANLNPFFSLFGKRNKRPDFFCRKRSRNLGESSLRSESHLIALETSARGAELVLEVSGSIRLISLGVHYSPKPPVNYMITECNFAAKPLKSATLLRTGVWGIYSFQRTEWEGFPIYRARALLRAQISSSIPSAKFTAKRSRPRLLSIFEPKGGRFLLLWRKKKKEFAL